MPDIKNTSNATQVLRDKAGKRHSLAPGESASIDVNPDSGPFKARLHAGAIVIGKEAKAAKPEAAKPAS